MRGTNCRLADKCLQLRATPEEMRLETERDLRNLLTTLCVEWGFCIPPKCTDEIVSRTSITAKEFAKAVLEAEEMNPEYEQAWVRKIANRFVEMFGESVE